MKYIETIFTFSNWINVHCEYSFVSSSKKRALPIHFISLLQLKFKFWISRCTNQFIVDNDFYSNCLSDNCTYTKYNVHARRIHEYYYCCDCICDLFVVRRFGMNWQSRIYSFVCYTFGWLHSWTLAIIVRKTNSNMYKVLFCCVLLWAAQIGSSLGSHEVNQSLPIVMWHGMGQFNLIFPLNFFTRNKFFIFILIFRRHMLFFIQFGFVQRFFGGNSWWKYICEIDSNRQ